MAAELKHNFDTDAELFPEGKGIFDVKVNGSLIYSKYATDRFPTENEVTDLINSQ